MTNLSSRHYSSAVFKQLCFHVVIVFVKYWMRGLVDQREKECSSSGYADRNWSDDMAPFLYPGSLKYIEADVVFNGVLSEGGSYYKHFIGKFYKRYALSVTKKLCYSEQIWVM